MSLTPSTLVADAVLLSFPHISEASYAPTSLLRVLSQCEKEIVNLYILTQPQRISTAGASIPCVVASNVTGYALSAGRNYTDFTWQDSDGHVWPIYMVPDGKQLDHAPKHPAGIIRGSTFFPADPLGARWSTSGQRVVFNATGDSINYRYIAEPTAVTTMTQTLVSPDEAQSYLLWSLVTALLLTAGAPIEKVQNAVANRDRAKNELGLIASKIARP